NPDHPVGAAHNHHSSAVTPFPSNDGEMGKPAASQKPSFTQVSRIPKQIASASRSISEAVW
ncbi:hypothetical protein, partial [Chromobacterium piscinae]|uniref:hypothetical protein n=1 Tax=Chromobacterium piscinae TaxID=686831 RepID=UPI003F80A6DF